MFFSTYKSTLKTLLRSRAFWIAVIAFVIVTVPVAWSRRVAIQIPEAVEQYVFPTWTQEQIDEYLEGLYSLSKDEYLSMANALIFGTFLYYALPVFAVISTVLVLNRDYGDSFFEIEKAAGVKSGRYLFGRLCGIVSLTAAVTFVWGLLLLHVQVISWGGVVGMSPGTYLLDSTFRMLRTTISGALPCVLFFVGLTYLLGALFKSGLAAAIGGFGYVAAAYLMFYFKNTLIYQKGYRWALDYFAYFTHVPEKLQYYLLIFRIDGEPEPEELGALFWANTSFSKALFCIAFMVGCSAIFTAISYWRVRRRET